MIRFSASRTLHLARRNMNTYVTRQWRPIIPQSTASMRRERAADTEWTRLFLFIGVHIRIVITVSIKSNTWFFGAHTAIDLMAHAKDNYDIPYKYILFAMQHRAVRKNYNKKSCSGDDTVWSYGRDGFHPIRWFYVLHFTAGPTLLLADQCSSITKKNCSQSANTGPFAKAILWPNAEISISEN